MPVPGVTTTPGARALIRLSTVGIGATSTASAALISATALPIARFRCSPTVPVTTRASSSTALGVRVIRIDMSPTRAVTVVVRYPMRSSSNCTSVPVSPRRMNLPFASVSVSIVVPTTRTAKVVTGVRDDSSRTTPDTEPSWAQAIAGVRASQKSGTRHTRNLNIEPP